MLNLTRPLLFFDLETTGLDTEKDRIVQLSAITFEKNMQCVVTIDLIFNPEIPINKEASDVHGFTNEKVKDKPLFKQKAKDSHLQWLVGPLVHSLFQ